MGSQEDYEDCKAKCHDIQIKWERLFASHFNRYPVKIVGNFPFSLLQQRHDVNSEVNSVSLCVILHNRTPSKIAFYIYINSGKTPAVLSSRGLLWYGLNADE